MFHLDVCQTAFLNICVKQLLLVHDKLQYATHHCNLANLCRSSLGQFSVFKSGIAGLISLLAAPLPVVLRIALPVFLTFRRISIAQLVTLESLHRRCGFRVALTQGLSELALGDMGTDQLSFWHGPCLAIERHRHKPRLLAPLEASRVSHLSVPFALVTSTCFPDPSPGGPSV